MTNELNQVPAYRPDDEIDLRELVKAIWDTRGPVLTAVIAFSALFWLAVVALGVRSGVTYQWESQVQFMFEGATEGIYPDESPFAPSDMLSPIIVQRVFEQNVLQEHGLTLAQFSNALSVEPYAPTREFIVQRFRGQLQQAGNSSAQIAQIQQAFAEALEEASRAYAVITLDLKDGVSPTRGVLDDALVQKVLLDIPKVWARYMTEQAGVFAEGLRIYSAETIEAAALGVMDGIVSADIIRGQFALLQHNLQSIAELANSGNVRDPQTGLRLGDIRAKADWLENFVLEDARVSLVAEIDAANPRASIRFFEGRIEELSRERDVLVQRATRVEAALESYHRGGSAGRAPRAERGPGTAGMLPDEFGGSTTISQFGSDFINRLIDLGSNATDLEFRQELTEERLDYTLQAADLNVEIARLEELKAVIEAQLNTARQSQSSSAAPDDTRGELGEISVQIRELVAATERLAERLGELRYGGQAAIYTVVSPPGEAKAPPLILTRSHLQRFVLGAFLVALVTVMLVFLVNMLRSRGDDEQAI